jgi:hypothetical protein
MHMQREDARLGRDWDRLELSLTAGPVQLSTRRDLKEIVRKDDNV